MEPLGKTCKKCTADQKQNKDGNSPVVPTLMSDGSFDTAHNSCQIDIGYRQLQAWDHLPRCARNAHLNRSRITSKRYPDVPEWPAIVDNDMSGEVDHLSPEWS